MSRTEKVATERLNFRVRPDDAERMRYAAEVEKVSLTDFVVDAARTRAEEVLSRVTVVPPDFFDQLMAALDQPPQPNAAMRKIARAARNNPIVKQA
jgi:uncharacterized protein (DUF1778 family)